MSGSSASKLPVHDERRRRTARSSWLASERLGASAATCRRLRGGSAFGGSAARGASGSSATGSAAGSAAARRAARRGGGSAGGSTVRSRRCGLGLAVRRRRAAGAGAGGAAAARRGGRRLGRRLRPRLGDRLGGSRRRGAARLERRVTSSATISGDSSEGGSVRVPTSASSGEERAVPDDGRKRRAASLHGWQRPHGINLGCELGEHGFSVAPQAAGWQLPARERRGSQFWRRRWPTGGGPRTLGGVSTSAINEPAPSGDAPPRSASAASARSDRRALTLRTLLTSGLSPRRRSGRRAGDARAARRLSRAASSRSGRRDAAAQHRRRVPDREVDGRRSRGGEPAARVRARTSIRACSRPSRWR